METKKLDLQVSIQCFREALECLEMSSSDEAKAESFWKAFNTRIEDAEKYERWDNIKSGYFFDEVVNKYRQLKED